VPQIGEVEVRHLETAQVEVQVGHLETAHVEVQVRHLEAMQVEVQVGHLEDLRVECRSGSATRGGIARGRSAGAAVSSADTRAMLPIIVRPPRSPRRHGGASGP